MQKYILFTVLLFAAITGFSKVKLPSILGNNAVLQRNARVMLWGSATPGAQVMITTSWNGHTTQVQAGDTGEWATRIPTPEAGGPYKIIYNDGEETVVENIAIGEVWVCSGQSNMQMRLRGAANQPILNSADLITHATNHHLRLFKVPPALSSKPVDDIDSINWQVSSPQSAAVFSAVAFQFGDMLQSYLNVPVGIIVSAYGGTPIRGWMAPEYLDDFPEMARDTTARINHWGPSYLYNAMIYPLRRYKIRGFLWYQGERDVRTPAKYEKMLPAMVMNWRELWGDDGTQMPFYYAQIAPWTYSNASGLTAAYMREAQLKARDNIVNSAVIATIDAGSNLSIHPPDKTKVAKRFFYTALAHTYNVPGISYLFPEYESMEVQGSSVLLKFKNTVLGIALHENLSAGLEIAGNDKRFYKVSKARPVGRDGLRVSCAEVKHPVAIRYCFKNYIIGNLYSVSGMPVFPFRTDDW